MNRTPKGVSVKGSDPQLLIQKILRERIYDCQFWREHLQNHQLDTVSSAIAKHLNYVGGCWANQRPTPFVCLLLKLLQLGADMPFVEELLRRDEKYSVVLALLYIRMIGKPGEIYRTLEPYLGDTRKCKVKSADGTFTVRCVDEIVETLLGYHLEDGESARVFDIPLPRIPTRATLVTKGLLQKRGEFVGDVPEPSPSAAGEAEAPVQVVQEGKGKRKEKWRL